MNNSRNLRYGGYQDKLIQNKKNLWAESRETRKNGERDEHEDTKNLCVRSETSTSFSDPEGEEMAQTKFESSSELSETRKFNQENNETVKSFQAFKRLPDGENHTKKDQNKTEFLSKLSDTKKDEEESVQKKDYTLEVFHTYNSFSDHDSREEKSQDGTEFSSELGGTKKEVERSDQGNAGTFRMFNASRDLNDELEILEQKTQKGSFLFETHHENSGDDSGKFQGLTADVSNKCATCQSEEDFLEEDLMTLRAKIALLESYINQLIQEKTELLAELNKTKENAQKDGQRITNSCPPNLYATDDELYEGRTQKCLLFLQTHKENCGDEIGCKLQHFASELERKFTACKNEGKSFEGELTKLRANWLSTLERLVNELTRDKTGLFAEIGETKESVKTGVQRNVDVLHCLNTPRSFIDDQNREEATPKGQVFENYGDEIRKLWEVAADLQAKYATCKIELAKQQALISGIISREEAETRANFSSNSI